MAVKGLILSHRFASVKKSKDGHIQGPLPGKRSNLQLTTLICYDFLNEVVHCCKKWAFAHLATISNTHNSLTLQGLALQM